MKIANKIALVTGGNRGIGEAISHELAKKGAHLLIASRRVESNLLLECKNLGAASVKHLPLDLSSKNKIDEFLQHLKQEKIEVDILVNNAGQLTGGLLEKQPIEDIYSMMQVNLLGLIHLTHSLLPGMLSRKRGKIVNNSSVSGVMHFPCATTYTAAKTAVVAFTESLRQELKGTGVSTLLLITPGVKTRMFDAIPDLYKDNLDVSFASASIPAAEWALRICEAIEDDRDILLPAGSTGISLKIAKYLPGFFEKIVEKKFKR